MLTLVVGGAGSGKSACAEEILCQSSGERKRVYLATMEPFGSEAEARIERHRALRAGKGFETIECYVNLEEVDITSNSAALLEDIGNLCANELFSPDGAGDGAAEAILCGVDRLRRRCAALVLVSNEVFTGGADYGEETLRYLSVLSYVNRKLAAMADDVCEVSGGIPVYYKRSGKRVR